MKHSHRNYVFASLLILLSVSTLLFAGTISGELKQWHRVDLTLQAVSSSEMAEPNPFLDYRFNVTFTAPSGKQYVVPGYFAGDGAGGDSGNIWRAHLNPFETGTWTYEVSFRSGTDVAVNLSANAGTAVSPYDGDRGSFHVGPSDKSGKDFRAPEKGMLTNKGDHYLTYTGSGKAFLYTGPGIPENILGYRGFTNTEVGIGHEFTVHEADWNPGDPDWGNGDGRALIGVFNYISDQGANCIYMMSMTIGGDGKDCFPHPTVDTTKSRYDLLKLDQWDIALSYAQSKGIFLHWHLAENELANYTYYGGSATGGSLTTTKKLSLRMYIARFGYYNGIKWNLMEECEWVAAERAAQMAYIKALDPYDHPITYQVGGAGIAYSTYESHYGDPNLDACSFQGSASRSTMFNTIQTWRNNSESGGYPWTCAWDEPQKIENDNTDEVNGYPMGRRDKMWPCLMGGGDGFMWYIQADGGGHGFDQRIEDFTIMQYAFNWCGYVRDFLEPLPLLQMNSSMNIVASSTGTDYTLYVPGQVYAIFNDRAGYGMMLDLSGVSGMFSVKWFDPRNGGTLQSGTVQQVAGGGNADLGAAPYSLDSDWAVLVERTDTGGNIAPLVSAGADLNLTLPDLDGYLKGTVTDDGLPDPPASVTTSWSKVSGPGTVAFTNTSAVDTDVSFSSEGVYVLRLTADDGEYTSSDTVTVTISDPAAADSVVSFTLINADTDAPVSGFDPIQNGAVINFADLPTIHLNIRANTSPAVVGSVKFGYDANADYQIESVSPYALAGDSSGDYDNWTPSLGSHTLTATPYTEKSAGGTAGNSLTVGFTVTDNAVVTYSLTVNSGSGDGTYEAGETVSITAAAPPAGKEFDQWTGDVSAVADIYDPTTTLSMPAQNIAVSATYKDLPVQNAAPSVDAGADQSITLPVDSVNLNGTVTDDGLPSGTLNTVWSKVSGPGSVTFGNISTVDTSAVFSSVGTYVLQLTADDSDLQSGDTVNITVNPEPQNNGDIVAAINCGGGSFTASDGTVYSADQYSLNGKTYSTSHSISGTEDDTLYKSERYHAALSYAIPLADGGYEVTLKCAEIWATSTGVRVFNIAVEGSLVIEALDLVAAAGHDAAYDVTFSVSVTDGVLNIDGTALTNNVKLSAILVKTGEEPVVNNAPAVSAGNDQSIILPADSVRLDGIVSDDGLPSGSLTVSWSIDSGPGSVVFADNSAADTEAVFTDEGTYVLRLTADDGELSSSDAVTVTVTDPGIGETVAGLTLINADTDVAVTGFDPLTDGAVINLSTLSTLSLNIKANTSPETVGSVRFDYDGLTGYQIENLSPYAIAGDSSGDYNSWTPSVGSHTLVVTPFSERNAAGTAGTPLSISFTVVDSDDADWTVAAAINCGGDGYTAADGTVYSADKYFLNGKTYSTSDAIAGTEDDILYKSERYNAALNYAIPLSNGEYQVTLKFAEIWATSAGVRVFNIEVENNPVADALDLVAAAGHDTAYDVKYTVTVTDGELDINGTALKNNVKLSAILVRTATYVPPATAVQKYLSVEPVSDEEPVSELSGNTGAGCSYEAGTSGSDAGFMLLVVLMVIGLFRTGLLQVRQ